MTDFRTLLTRAYPDLPSERQRILAFCEEVPGGKSERMVKHWLAGTYEPDPLAVYWLKPKAK